MFFLLSAVTIRDLLYVREDTLKRRRSSFFLKLAGGTRSSIGGNVSGHTFVTGNPLDADSAGAGSKKTAQIVNGVVES